MEVFIARQPIFDRGRVVRAYELLFRGGVENVFSAQDGNEATRQVLVNGFIHFGMPMLTAGGRAFINLTRDVLVQECIHLFPPSVVVAEILETVDEDPEVVRACIRLKDRGYMIALDDFVDVAGHQDLLRLADIVKLDFRALGPAERTDLKRRLLAVNPHVRLLAEKVETYQEFQQAIDEGFTYFQGYFFAKPEMLRKKTIPGSRLHYIELLRELYRSDLDLYRLEAVMRQDMSLSYRLLRYINSAFFGWRSEIRSLRHALVLMGERDIRKWAALVALSCMSDDKPVALLLTGLTRARFCEQIAERSGMAKEADQLFLAGMFSVIDAVIDKPLLEALETIAIPKPVFEALVGQGGPHRMRLDLVLAHENANWSKVSELAEAVGIPERDLPELYLEAVAWAEKSFSPPIDSSPPRV